MFVYSFYSMKKREYLGSEVGTDSLIKRASKLNREGVERILGIRESVELLNDHGQMVTKTNSNEGDEIKQIEIKAITRTYNISEMVAEGISCSIDKESFRTKKEINDFLKEKKGVFFISGKLEKVLKTILDKGIRKKEFLSLFHKEQGELINIYYLRDSKKYLLWHGEK